MSIVNTFIKIREREEKEKKQKRGAAKGVQGSGDRIDGLGGEKTGQGGFKEEAAPDKGHHSKTPATNPQRQRRSLTKAEANALNLALYELLLKQRFLTRRLILKKFAPHELDNKACDAAMDKRLQRLCRKQFIRKMQVSGQNLYLLDESGYQMLPDSSAGQLEIVQSVDEQQLAHDLICSELRIYLENCGCSQWASESELRLHPERPEHYPDAAFTAAGKICFLEVELTRKSTSRYERLASLYSLPKGPDHIVYFYRGDRLGQVLAETMGDNPRVALFPYIEPLSGPDTLTGLHQYRTVSLQEFLKS